MTIFVKIIQSLVLAGMIISAILVIKSRDLLASVVYLAVMSLMLAVEFYILQAPDVAIAEAAVGTALSSAIYIIAIHHTHRYEK